VAKAFPDSVFVVSCDLNPSTKLAKACSFLKEDHQFEVSIEEQVATLMTNGLALSGMRPQLNVVSTFAAFFEGIAREGMEMWRYQRNLNGVNEGLNVCFHLSHVGACTGRDHFSGWSLDWINLGIGYLSYTDRFYAPADARAAFVAVKDLAARNGGHIIGIPRDNLPILTRQDGTTPLFAAETDWEAVTPLRSFGGAKKAVLAFGATAFLAAEACEKLQDTDAYVINGLPAPKGALRDLVAKYPGGVITIEDGIIDTRARGLQGFAGLMASLGDGVPMDHIGITDPRIAPSEGHMETWAHFGITAEALVEAVAAL
jgi:transketolase C-terminal domain/subunit